MGGSIEPGAPDFRTPCEDDSACDGGTVCGAPFTEFCIGYCGSADPFEGNCPEGTTCQDFGIQVCAPPE